jgi:hypothetical protein
VREAYSQKPSGSRERLRSWRVVLIRNRREFLGDVQAVSLEAAKLTAAKRFGLSEFHRKRLLLQERL